MARKERAPIVVAGDFNAPHHAWGYPRTEPKGADLWQTASDLNLTLVTDPAFPTRTGNSCSRDSTPDLTFVGSEGEVSWVNLGIDLGSDHCILSTTIQLQGKPPERSLSRIGISFVKSDRRELATKACPTLTDGYPRPSATSKRPPSPSKRTLW